MLFEIKRFSQYEEDKKNIELLKRIKPYEIFIHLNLQKTKNINFINDLTRTLRKEFNFVIEDWGDEICIEIGDSKNEKKVLKLLEFLNKNNIIYSYSL